VLFRSIHGLGIFGNDQPLDFERPTKLGILLKPIQDNRHPEILIASQHSRSLQWQGMPTMETWIENTVNVIRKYSNRKIIVRPHPRSPISLKIHGVEIGQPKLIQGTYDDFDIDYGYHCVINYNSGPAVQAAIKGVPIVCDSTSLAAAVSGKIENIENISLPNREEWFLKLCHTEWTIDEIAQGIPLQRLMSVLT
jgi:hypothetical protein